MSGANDFDFLVGSWNIHNKRKTGKSFWADHEPEEETMWEEFLASDLIEKRLDGRAVVEHYEATLPSGESVKALSVKAFDPTTQHWSIMWIDTREGSDDFRPLTGTFQDGVGTFSQVIETPDGKPLQVRFIWDCITSDAARWQQAFSFDGGTTWNTNFLMQFTRRG
jgi:hypothetical protein